MKLSKKHSFLIQSNAMCVIRTDESAYHGYFVNKFEVHDNDWMGRMFMDVSENGVNSPRQMLVGECEVLSLGTMVEIC